MNKKCYRMDRARMASPQGGVMNRVLPGAKASLLHHYPGALWYKGSLRSPDSCPRNSLSEPEQVRDLCQGDSRRQP